jgi:hypothetical protein
MTAMHREHRQEDYGLEFERVQDCNNFNVEGAQSANIVGAHVSLKEASEDLVNVHADEL